MKTDNEIIKALECYIKENEFEYFHSNTMNEYPLIRKALGLINRQKAEIERLKESRDTIVKMKQCIGVKKEVEADAVKKFTDKLFNELAGYENMFDELQDWSARNTVLQLTHALKKFVDNNEKYEEVVIKL